QHRRPNSVGRLPRTGRGGSPSRGRQLTYRRPQKVVANNHQTAWRRVPRKRRSRTTAGYAMTYPRKPSLAAHHLSYVEDRKYALIGATSRFRLGRIRSGRSGVEVHPDIV